MHVIKAAAVLIAASAMAACTAAPAPPSVGSSQPPAAPGPVADRDLQLRPVLTLESAHCTPGSTPAPVSASPIRACAADGTIQYTLGPAAVTGSQVQTIAVGTGLVSGTAEIDITLDAAGAAALAAVTGEVSQLPEPRTELAIYVHGRVQSAPYVSSAIEGGSMIIRGDFTTAQAQAIVDSLMTHT